jgi:hypothetical protein
MNIKAHFQYLKYLLRHKLYVFVECAKRGYIWRGITHDLSKFRLSQWNPYVQYFYGIENKDAFEQAWNEHQKIEKHHWQHWLLIPDNGNPKALEMPDKYIIELEADWVGAGKAQGYNKPNEVQDWYNKNKNNMILHPVTREKIEKMIFSVDKS